MDQEHSARLEAWLGLLQGSVQEILRSQDRRTFFRWMEREAPLRLPEEFAGLTMRRGRALSLALARGIWNEVPLPRNGFRPEPIPEPAPGAPCPCGSRRSYRSCCAAAPGLPPLAAKIVRILASLASGRS